MKWIIIILSFLLLACSVQKRAQKKLNKAIELDPSIVKRDTMVIKDTIFIPGFQGDTTVDLNTSTEVLDNVIEMFEESLDSTTFLKLRDTIRHVYINRSILTKPFVWEDSLVKIVIKQHIDDKLHISYQMKDRAVIYDKSLITNEVICTLRFWQKFFIWSGKVFWILFLIGIFVLIVYIKVFKDD